MSNAETWALIITIHTTTIGIALGAYLHGRGWTPAKWMSWPTDFLHEQIQRVVSKFTRA